MDESFLLSYPVPIVDYHYDACQPDETPIDVVVMVKSNGVQFRIWMKLTHQCVLLVYDP